VWRGDLRVAVAARPTVFLATAVFLVVVAISHS